MNKDRIWLAQFGWITLVIGIFLMGFVLDFAMVWLGSLALTGLVVGIILKYKGVKEEQ